MNQPFGEFYKWGKRELNLELDGYKERQLQRRINTIMRKNGLEDLEEYSQLITQDSSVKKEFLDYITINVTEFCRNKDIFSEFEDLLIHSLAKEFPRLKIWSAACSTGAEAYSLAMVVDREKIADRCKIIGTDIDETILEKARRATYPENEIKNIAKKDLSNYFIQSQKQYYLKDEIKKRAEFKKQDLILEEYDKGFHAILCRNVTIYFKDDVKETIYQKMSDSLVTGGIFFIGATETIYHPENYHLKKIGSFLYQKI